MSISRKIIDLAPIVLLIFCLFLLLPYCPFFNQPSAGLDPSYHIANHLAHQFHLVYGRDFVFTYGPLGILYSRYPIAISLGVYLLFDLYLLVSALFVLKAIFKVHFGPGALLYLVIALILNIGVSQPDHWYMLFLLFYVLAFIRGPFQLFPVFQAALLSLLCFYCKLNLGIVAMLVFLVGITYAVMVRRTSIRTYALILLGYLLFIWLSAMALNVYLPGYIRGSLHLIDAYNDAMSLDGDQMGRYLIAALIVMAVFVLILGYRIQAVIRRKERGKLSGELLTGGIGALLVFVFFKSAFVREDAVHAEQFFVAVVPLAGLLYLYSRPGRDRWVLGVGCWAILVVSYIVLPELTEGWVSWRRVASMAVLRDKGLMAARYFNGIRQYNTALDASAQLARKDNALRRIVGDATIDIAPTEISTIYFNGLHYDPRPVVQSYSVYDGYLDSLNYQKYRSADAPEYVLFSLSSIDNRQPFFDEPRTKLALISGYRIVGKIGDDLLLKKRIGALRLRPAAVADTIAARIDQDIPIGQGAGLQVSKLLIHYNFRGKMRRLLYHPPRLELAITLADGEVKLFRGVKPLLADGVLLNKYVENTDDFQFLLQTAGRMNQPISKIRVITDPGEHGFDSSISLISTRYYFSNPSREEALVDSLAIAGLLTGYEQYRPRLVDTGGFIPEHFRLGIEKMQQHSRLLKIEGWAFRRDADNMGNAPTIVLSAVGASYALPTVMRTRADLNGSFGRADLASSGFVAMADQHELLPGSYRVGVLIRDTVNRKAWVDYDTYAGVTIMGDRIDKTDGQHLGALSGGNMVSGLEQAVINYDQLIISGWAFVKGSGSGVIPTNVLLRSGKTVYRIPAVVGSRGDVAGVYKDAAALNAGFMIRRRIDALPADTYTIGIEKWDSAGRVHVLIFTDRTIQLGSTDFQPAPLDPLPSTVDLPMNVESLRDSGNKIVVSGWVAAKTANIRTGKILILLKAGNAAYSAGVLQAARADVSAAFRKQGMEGAGFVSTIDKTGLLPGRYQVGIAIYQDTVGVVRWTDRTVTVP